MNHCTWKDLTKWTVLERPWKHFVRSGRDYNFAEYYSTEILFWLFYGRPNGSPRELFWCHLFFWVMSAQQKIATIEGEGGQSIHHCQQKMGVLWGLLMSPLPSLSIVVWFSGSLGQTGPANTCSTDSDCSGTSRYCIAFLYTRQKMFLLAFTT